MGDPQIIKKPRETSTDEGEDGLALTERRWNEVSNLREVLQQILRDEE
jgi:hypothetical protein